MSSYVLGLVIYIIKAEKNSHYHFLGGCKIILWLE